jgi:hypothetical protein
LDQLNNSNPKWYEGLQFSPIATSLLILQDLNSPQQRWSKTISLPYIFHFDTSCKDIMEVLKREMTSSLGTMIFCLLYFVILVVQMWRKRIKKVYYPPCRYV